MEQEIHRCGAPTRAGSPCRRRVRAGAGRCALHAVAPLEPAVQLPLLSGPFADLFTLEERGMLKALSDDARIDDVIPVLVVAIRRALAGQAAPGVVVRACEAFVRALRERQRLAETGESEFERARNEALDRLSEELGIPL